MRDKIKVVFLDRDGTIIEDYPDEKWGEVKTPVFLNGAIHTLKRLRESNYEIIILTNQYIINQGIISLEQYYEFTRRLVNILLDNDIVLKDIFFCPHTKEEGCKCYKPKPGLFEQATLKYPNIDLDESLLVGDSFCDIELGNRVGIKTYGINIKSDQFEYIEIESLQKLTDLLDLKEINIK
ncbi:D-glycero-alpha-D-manno-heptose-1,7-bisphosphate 7-phosphatase [Candidatus Galacturonibacter soehngenii]|uniref:D-glycero-alpha-D-manno-heptose-1,7-bisphosphate 7-phosphatase n=1 Tax=Candidatus Galacturonatibacter soehngenii TaxID=2307010 RepID=UPI001FAB1131|nr:HAD-IIIA family hydrolase [Candidatus Galacturonibacter soehngenii]